VILKARDINHIVLTNNTTTNMKKALGETQTLRAGCSKAEPKKLVPWGTDGRLPLSDLDNDLGSGHTAYRRASLIDVYLRTKFH